MKNIIQIKSAGTVEVGDYVLSPNFPEGILIAEKVGSIEVVGGGDDGQWVEIGVGLDDENIRGKRLFLMRPDALVVVAI
jgi:hypothetical protein